MGDMGEMFQSIHSLRRHASAAAAEDDFVVVEDVRTWNELFDEHFFRNDDGDDMLFYVKHGSTDLAVVRKTAATEPMREVDVNWEESVYLNLFLQKFRYTLTMVVCVRAETYTRVLHRTDHVVYCSPSRREMQGKGAAEVPTFPDLYFPVDTFDELFAAIAVPADALLRVELVAAAGPITASVFSGQVSHAALAAAFSKVTTGAARTPAAQEFLPLTGPNNVGRAQIAVGFTPTATGAGLRGLFSGISRALGTGPPRDTPLNACVTFTSLSLVQLVAAVFEAPRTPVLRAAVVGASARASSGPASFPTTPVATPTMMLPAAATTAAASGTAGPASVASNRSSGGAAVAAAAATAATAACSSSSLPT